MRPQRQQPTRLPRPWDSPGKNIEVGCHFLLQYMKVKSEREVAQLCSTLSDPMYCSLPGSSIHGIFQARVLEWDAMVRNLPNSPSLQKTDFSGLRNDWLGVKKRVSKTQSRHTHTHSLFPLSPWGKTALYKYTVRNITIIQVVCVLTQIKQQLFALSHTSLPLFARPKMVEKGNNTVFGKGCSFYR